MQQASTIIWIALRAGFSTPPKSTMKLYGVTAFLVVAMATTVLAQHKEDSPNERVKRRTLFFFTTSINLLHVC